MTDMTSAAWLAYALFAFVASITPGPNNLMLLASGVNHGFRRTIPHMLGITIGFCIMLAIVGLGLAEFFLRLPVLHDVVRWIGAAYLVYLATRIATAAPPAQDQLEGAARGAPLGFVGAALFQWVNVKAWATALTAFSAYVPAGRSIIGIVGVAGVFGLVNVPCICCWTLFGSWMRRWLREPRRARLFNIAMAMLLVLSLVPVMR